MQIPESEIFQTFYVFFHTNKQNFVPFKDFSLKKTLH